MSEQWLEDYLAAWTEHPRVAGADGDAVLARLLGFMSTDVVYEDVPTASVFRGHAGVAEMGRGAHAMSSDMRFDVVSAFDDGASFAFEVVVSGSNTGALGPLPGTGKPFRFRSVSVGSVSGGLVVAQRDYWDLAGLLGQLGA